MPRTVPQLLPVPCIDLSARSPEEIVLEQELKDLVSSILSGNERLVIESRFFSPGPKPTFREIGEELDVSAERVRQIEERALKKLKPRISWE